MEEFHKIKYEEILSPIWDGTVSHERLPRKNLCEDASRGAGIKGKHYGVKRFFYKSETDLGRK